MSLHAKTSTLTLGNILLAVLTDMKEQTTEIRIALIVLEWLQTAHSEIMTSFCSREIHWNVENLGNVCEFTYHRHCEINGMF